MTPLQIEMILHFHCHVDPWDRADAPACVEAFQGFIRDGLIEPTFTMDRPTLTNRGRAFIHFLTTLPLPVEMWSIPGAESMSFSAPEAAMRALPTWSAGRD